MAAITSTEVSTSQTRSSYDYNDWWCRSHFPACSSGMATSTNLERYDFITFLETCQNLEIDFLPITWQPALDRLGTGAQSEVLQSLVNLDLSFAFNCVKVPRYLSRDVEDEEEDTVYRALVSQALVLGHSEIRNHSNINNLVGVCWDVRRGEGIHSQTYIQPPTDVLFEEHTPSSKWKVWPVLVFEKSKHGDLDRFMRSATGSNLDITGRLKLCVNIASGIRSLHENCIIHGDIKPHNVLIFEERPGLYAAKLSDLGHSIPFRNDGDRAPMACSRPWQAPEHSHRKTYQLSDMISMEVYSFGMVCLWLLFHERLFELGITFDLRSMEAKALDHLNALKDGEGMSEVAQKLTREVQELSANQILDLTGFFDSCLAPNNGDRGCSISSLLQLLSDRFITSMATVSTAPAMRTLSNEPHQHFKISKSALAFYQSDYRVRIYIVFCLRERLWHAATQDTGDDLQSQQAAFQLALCFHLGFGVIADDEEVQGMLQWSARPIQDLEKEISSIGRVDFKGNLYTSLSHKGYHADTLDGYYYHKSDVLDEAREELQKDMISLIRVFYDCGRIVSSVRTKLARIFGFQGQWKEEKRLQMQEMMARKTMFHKEEVKTLIWLATFQGQKHWTETEELKAQMTEIEKRELGENHSDTLIDSTKLASIYRNLGCWRDAEQVEELSALEEEHPHTLTDMNNLAIIYGNQGHWTEAERLQTQVLKTRKRVLEEEHPYTMVSMSNLASTFQDQGRWTESEKLEMQVLKTEKRVLGEEHPDTLITMSNLALSFLGQGRFTEAEELEVQVLKTKKRVLGEEHPHTLMSMSNLASSLWSQKRCVEAERLQVQVIETRKRILGEEHPHTLTETHSLALTYQIQGRWTEAERLLVQVIETEKKILEEEHPVTLTSMNSLASVFLSQGRSTEAEELEMQVLKTRKRVLGEEHPSTLTSMNNLAHTYKVQGRHKEAAALLRNVVQLRNAVIGSTHPETLASVECLNRWSCL